MEGYVIYKGRYAHEFTPGILTTDYYGHSQKAWGVQIERGDLVLLPDRSTGMTIKENIVVNTGDKRYSSSLTATGHSGYKEELTDPDSFFKEKVLTHDAARQWMYETFKKQPTPEVWMLVGRYLLSDAQVTTCRRVVDTNSEGDTESEPGSTGSAGDSSPAERKRSVPEAETSTYTAHGSKLWAAKWRRVSPTLLYPGTGVNPPVSSSLLSTLPHAFLSEYTSYSLATFTETDADESLELM